MPSKIDSKNAIALMRQAGLKPLDQYVNSKKPWKCIHIKCGRVVSPTYNGIQRGQGACKYCAGKAVSPEDAKKLFLANNLKPLEPYSGNNKKPWRSIHIPCGNEVSPSYNIIQRQESIGCHFCSDQFIDPDEAYRYYLTKDLQPLEPFPGSAKPWKSIHLICGSVIQPRYGHIRSGRRGCPVCAGNIQISQEKAFAFYRQNGLEPQESFKGPHHPWKSVHKKCGRKVSPRWANVQQGASGCAYCSGKKVDIKEAKILLKKLDLKPLEPFKTSHTPWKCTHLKCGRKVSPTYSALINGQGPCVYCGKNMIKIDEALDLLKKNNFKPLEKFPGGSKPWLCFHKPCKNVISLNVNYLKYGGKGCKVCAGLVPISEATALKLFKSRGFTPQVKFQGSKVPWKSKHNVCKKVVSPTYESIRSGRGCKYCQIGGINLKAPGYLYLITNELLNSHKIGIGGAFSSQDRLDLHIKHGWKLYKRMEFKTAEKAYEVEQMTITWLRFEMVLPQYLSPEQMPQRGHTETVDASEIDLPILWSKIIELSKNN
jgi:hypothetical protein